ncbi:MAG TPA: thiamine pyrophosphate-binding protein [Bryobacteraceae bacterium]|nr:thiamine pyrophosphate-binding protein [Bryobacteraceae bacterium]
MTGARFIAETLKGYGVSHVFFMESILRLSLVEMEELGIRRILTHSEAAAAYMADGYARAGGRPGVCMAQSVGAANLAAGLQDAYLGRSPVIAITGRKPPLAQHRNAYQEISHASLFASVTRYAASAAAAEQLPFLLPQVFREATAETPRPVYLEVAGLMGEFIERAEAPMKVHVERRNMCCPAHRLAPEPDLIEEACERLANSARPVIVAGRGARVSSAAAELRTLAEDYSIPVAYALDGKSLLPDTHPACVGVVGSYSAKSANRVVSEADLVVFVGCDTGDQATFDWQVPGPGTAVIQIDADSTEPGRNYPSALPVLGDPKLALRALIEALPRAVNRQAWLHHVQSIVEEWNQELAEPAASDATPIRVERLCAEITRRLPADAVLVSDTGYSGIWSGTMIRMTSESQLYLRSAGTLGWAFPASLGAKCALPYRPVVCFTGDGGFYYHLSELETAARWRIPTVTVVNNNSGFGQCLIPVERVYGSRAGKPSDLTGFSKVNFARIAEDLGCRGIRVEHPDEIGPALDTALGANGPTVIDVVTDPRPRAPAPLAPGAR